MATAAGNLRQVCGPLELSSQTSYSIHDRIHSLLPACMFMEERRELLGADEKHPARKRPLTSRFTHSEKAAKAPEAPTNPNPFRNRY
jgi:hypothetical protein